MTHGAHGIKANVGIPLCPLCDAPSGSTFLRLEKLPVFCNVLHDSIESAAASAMGEMELVCCALCGLVWNRAFDASLVKYAEGYENSLHHSPSFRSYADKLAARLVQEYRLEGKNAVEVGCGDGEFLRRLLCAGAGRGYGYDPSLSSGLCEPGIQLYPQYFQESIAPEACELLVCRHVLEHIPQPGIWLGQLAKTIRSKDPVMYFEVPNGQWIFETSNLWDIIYEHVTYWTPAAISRLFHSAEVKVLATGVGFGRQFLSVEGRMCAPQGARDFSDATTEADPFEYVAFAEQVTQMLGRWRAELESLRSRGGKGVIWGAGSKGVTFANLMNSHAINGAVDLNPKKHGKFLPGVGVPVVPPAVLTATQPDTVFIMNAVYEEEIRSTLSELNVQANVAVVMDSSEG